MEVNSKDGTEIRNTGTNRRIRISFPVVRRVTGLHKEEEERYGVDEIEGNPNNATNPGDGNANGKKSQFKEKHLQMGIEEDMESANHGDENVSLPEQDSGDGSSDGEKFGTGCLVCGKDDKDDLILLCEECDGEYHIYCLTPPLHEVPDDDWYCPICKEAKAKVKAKAAHTPSTYRGGRRRRRYSLGMRGAFGSARSTTKTLDTNKKDIATTSTKIRSDSAVSVVSTPGIRRRRQKQMAQSDPLLGIKSAEELEFDLGTDLGKHRIEDDGYRRAAKDHVLSVDDDDQNSWLEELVSGSSEGYVSRFGEICWAQGGAGYGWWPSLIMDPRSPIVSQEPKVQYQIRKFLGMKFLVYFFRCGGGENTSNYTNGNVDVIGNHEKTPVRMTNTINGTSTTTTTALSCDQIAEEAHAPVGSENTAGRVASSPKVKQDDIKLLDEKNYVSTATTKKSSTQEMDEVQPTTDMSQQQSDKQEKILPSELKVSLTNDVGECNTVLVGNGVTTTKSSESLIEGVPMLSEQIHNESFNSLGSDATTLHISSTSRCNAHTAATNSEGIFNAIAPSSSSASSSSPFSILHPKQIKSWEEGLAEELYMGKVARQHGLQRYRTFQEAFQIAWLEIDRPPDERFDWDVTNLAGTSITTSPTPQIPVVSPSHRVAAAPNVVNSPSQLLLPSQLPSDRRGRSKKTITDAVALPIKATKNVVFCDVYNGNDDEGHNAGISNCLQEVDFLPSTPTLSGEITRANATRSSIDDLLTSFLQRVESNQLSHQYQERHFGRIVSSPSGVGVSVNNVNSPSKIERRLKISIDKSIDNSNLSYKLINKKPTFKSLILRDKLGQYKIKRTSTVDKSSEEDSENEDDHLFVENETKNRRLQKKSSSNLNIETSASPVTKKKTESSLKQLTLSSSSVTATTKKRRSRAQLHHQYRHDDDDNSQEEDDDDSREIIIQPVLSIKGKQINTPELSTQPTKLKQKAHLLSTSEKQKTVKIPLTNTIKKRKLSNTNVVYHENDSDKDYNNNEAVSQLVKTKRIRKKKSVDSLEDTYDSRVTNKKNIINEKKKSGQSKKFAATTSNHNVSEENDNDDSDDEGSDEMVCKISIKVSTTVGIISSLNKYQSTLDKDTSDISAAEKVKNTPVETSTKNDIMMENKEDSNIVRFNKNDDVVVGFVIVPDRQTATFVTLRRRIVEDLVPDCLETDDFKFFIPNLGPVSQRQEKSLGKLVPFLSKTMSAAASAGMTSSIGEGTYQSPVNITIVVPSAISANATNS